MKQKDRQITISFTPTKRKNYSAPELTMLGKVYELTAGGHSGDPECAVNPHNDKLKCKSDIKLIRS
jgi:hypothetical protein